MEFTFLNAVKGTRMGMAGVFVEFSLCSEGTQKYVYSTNKSKLFLEGFDVYFMYLAMLEICDHQ